MMDTLGENQDGLTDGQKKLLAFLESCGSGGINMFELFRKSEEIGFTPDDQAGLVEKGLWGTKFPNLIIHPSFK